MFYFSLSKLHCSWHRPRPDPSIFLDEVDSARGVPSRLRWGNLNTDWVSFGKRIKCFPSKVRHISPSGVSVDAAIVSSSHRWYVTRLITIVKRSVVFYIASTRFLSRGNDHRVPNLRSYPPSLYLEVFFLLPFEKKAWSQVTVCQSINTHFCNRGAVHPPKSVASSRR